MFIRQVATLQSIILTMLYETVFCQSVAFIIKLGEGPFIHSRSSEVIDFGTNRQRVYTFLLVINNNFSPLLYRLGDMAAYSSNIANFTYPTLIITPPLWETPQQFGMKLASKTRGIGHAATVYGESFAILASTVFKYFQIISNR